MVAFCKQKNFHTMQQKAKISLLFKIDKGMEGFFLKEKERRTALSFNRPLSLWLLSESKYRRVRLVALYHFVTLTSLRPCSVRRDKLSQRIYSDANYLYHK